ncbi:hypothetical protein EN865_33145 [bacterium M00.F.Ca.ET.222.01.1.1]|nr:hypothetical protein EN865_33145 [bacterium M00.F.Ca.ET.222.01.1.1]
MRQTLCGDSVGPKVEIVVIGRDRFVPDVDENCLGIAKVGVVIESLEDYEQVMVSARVMLFVRCHKAPEL